jgi:hypothetical protein
MPWLGMSNATTAGLMYPQTAFLCMILESTLTCPICGHHRRESMPVDACIRFYECEGCGAMLTPKAGDCCVFCSWGDVACPPVQKEGGCCRT